MGGDVVVVEVVRVVVVIDVEVVVLVVVVDVLEVVGLVDVLVVISGVVRGKGSANSFGSDSTESVTVAQCANYKISLSLRFYKLMV